MLLASPLAFLVFWCRFTVKSLKYLDLPSFWDLPQTSHTSILRVNVIAGWSRRADDEIYHFGSMDLVLVLTQIHLEIYGKREGLGSKERWQKKICICKSKMRRVMAPKLTLWCGRPSCRCYCSPLNGLSSVAINISFLLDKYKLIKIIRYIFFLKIYSFNPCKWRISTV